MAEVTLKVTKRETGKQIGKQYRKSGQVPGVYYIKGEEAIPVLSDPMSLRPIIYTQQTKIVNLEIEGEEIRKCVIKDVVMHPVTEQITHFDLMGLKDDQIISVQIPFKFIGQSPGVMAGGVFGTVMYKVKVKCLPADLPEFLEIDISDLEVGSSAYLDPIREKYPNVEFAIKGNAVVCTVSRPRVETETEEGAVATEGETAVETGAETEA
jgi:large subunit ribosomal protein L25